MRGAAALILHLNVRGIRSGGDQEVGLQAAVRDRVDEIDAGEDAAIGDAAVSRQVDAPLAGSANHEVDAGRQFADSLDGGRGVRTRESHAKAALAHGEHGAIRAEVAGECGALDDVADVRWLRAQLPAVLDEEDRNLAVSGLRRLDKASRQDARDGGRPKAGTE